MANRIELTELERKKLSEAGRQSIPCTHGWRPIETAPKDGTNILVVWDGVVEIAEWNKVADNWQGSAYGDFAIGNEVTHWQPLPKPPK